MNDDLNSRLGWYLRRLSSMSPAEVYWRARDKAVHLLLARRQVSRAEAIAGVTVPSGPRTFCSVLPPQACADVADDARAAVLAAADLLLRGQWEVLGVTRTDLVAPDWFYDPVTGRRAPADRYAFRINHRSESQTGNIKQVWEISRLQHLTLLAAAWFLSRDERYAARVADQLRSWWRENPFLSGVHWTSGIEIGIRLISMSWIRRLLNDWPGVTDLFEDNDLAVAQIGWHLQYLAKFSSRGSSANNHVIAEAAGMLVGSCAFPWFRDSQRHQARAARLLEREFIRNTFPSGIGRELASDYQLFVAELAMLAAVEADAAGSPLSQVAWQRLGAMADSGAALLDERSNPPRQGDGDEGRGILLDDPGTNRWASFLAVADALFGRLDWWPRPLPGVMSTIIASLAGAPRQLPGRPAERTWHFGDAGVTLLRTKSTQEPEIWCRCDGGPHGYLSIAAHAHADALSVELRFGGVEVFADVGTYCYHGQPEWRSYFRSTIAHNTVEVDGESQSAEGGPFLWLRHARSRVVYVEDIGDAAEWIAEHDGYSSLSPPALHRRCVRLDRASRAVCIVDEVTSAGHDLRLAFHLGPDVQAELDGSRATLRWPDSAAPGAASLELPSALCWSLHRGETDPVLGWYSAGLGRRTPTYTLVGCGRSAAGQPLSTRLEFMDMGASRQLSATQPAISWRPSNALARELAARDREA